MNRIRVGLMVLCCLMLVVTACRQQPIPTPLPVAVVPTVAPTRTSLPPTMDLTATSSPAEPATPTEAPTLRPAPTATPTTTHPGINITAPEAQSDILIGSDILARGLVQLPAGHTAWLSLATLNGILLQETQATLSDVGWEAGLTIPNSVAGTVYLVASIRDESGQVIAQNRTAVNLVLDTAASDRYLALFRPVAGDKAMGGFNLFFDGRAQLPVNNTVTISVWSEDCQTQVARQSFVLRGSGYWQGFVIIPNTTSGPGCAIAHFGTPGEDTWREVQVPIDILANDESNASGVVIGNPPPNSSINAGEELLIYGTALNASEATIQVSILLENGRIVTQNNTDSDYWGYWEFPALLPFDVEGPAVITVSVGDPTAANYAQAQTLITINPAPTPRP